MKKRILILVTFVAIMMLAGCARDNVPDGPTGPVIVLDDVVDNYQTNLDIEEIVTLEDFNAGVASVLDDESNYEESLEDYMQSTDEIPDDITCEPEQAVVTEDQIVVDFEDEEFHPLPCEEPEYNESLSSCDDDIEPEFYNYEEVMNSNNTEYKVTASSLNVRMDVNSDSEKLGALPYGTRIIPKSFINGWAKIDYNNQEAFVKMEYLEEYVGLGNNLSSQGSDYVIVINPHYNTLDIYYQNETLKNLSCATGKASTPSPQGCFTISNKCVNPYYSKTNCPGGDPNNPLGKRWMGLSVPGTGGSTYGIHGTNDESSIGNNASHGCIRMHNADVEEVYDVLPIGTTVIICDCELDDATIAASYGILLTMK